MEFTRRRALLGAIGAVGSVAGCIDRSDGDGTSAEPTDGTDDYGTTTDRDEPPESPTTDAPLAWSTPVDRPIGQAPLVADQTVYVTSEGPKNDRGDPRFGQTGSISAVDATAGNRRWTVETEAPPTNYVHATDESVYVVTGYSSGLGGVEQRLRKLERDGTWAWQTEPVDDYLSLVAVGEARAYVGTMNDNIQPTGEKLFAADVADGRRHWTVEAGDPWEGWLRGGTLVLREGPGMRVRDSADGSVQFAGEADPVTDAIDRPAIVDSRMVIETIDGRLRLLDLTSGDDLWTAERSSGATFTGSGAILDDVALVAASGTVVGLSLADGTRRWTVQIDGQSIQDLLLADESLYVSDQQGRVYAIDPTGATRRWKRDVASTTASVVGATGGALLVRTDDADEQTLVSLDVRDGQVRWRYAIDGEAAQATVADRRVYVGRGDGVLLALDA